MSVPRFTVYTVLQDGNAIDVLQTNSPSKAVERLKAEWKKYEGIKHRHHAVIYTDDPEQGDLDTSDLYEMVLEEKAQGVVWAIVIGGAAIFGLVVFLVIHLRGHQ